MKKYRRFLAWTLSAAMAASVAGAADFPAYAQDAPDEKQYVILAEGADACEQVAEEAGDGVVEEEAALPESRVIVARLTEAEAEELAKEDGVWVGEDVVLEGSEPEAGEAAVQDARARMKEEKIRRAAEAEAGGEPEGAEEEPEPEWNLQAVNAAEEAGEAGEGSRRARVAVLDSGVDFVSGIDLSGSVCLVEEEADLPEMFQDAAGHGTAVAGVIAGNGETGIRGVNPGAEVYSVKVLDCENKAPLSRVIRGLYWCIENDIDIVNMSFGTPAYSEALEKAVADACASGILMIAAAGNGGAAVEYPAAFDGVVAVAASDAQSQVSELSNAGEELEIAAPGEKVRVAACFDGSRVASGTSVAAPHVAGAASLIWEKDLSRPASFVRGLLAQSARAMEGEDGCGLLDVGYALESYDEYAARFDGTDGPQAEIPRNPERPQSFEEVDADEAYVEGRWDSAGHKKLVNDADAGLSANAVDIVKKGIVFPDTETIGWHVMNGNKKDRNNWWHGKLSFTENGVKTEINYVAVLELVTTVALQGGSFSGIAYTDIMGMNKTVFNKVKADLAKLDYNALGFANTKENRKYFLYGCALHEMTDAFAHATTTPDGRLIRHTNPGAADDADTVLHYFTRYDVAKKAVSYSLKSLSDDVYSDGEEILKAFNAEYKDTTKFKMVKIKPYMNANGYSGAVLTRANIDSYK